MITPKNIEFKRLAYFHQLPVGDQPSANHAHWGACERNGDYRPAAEILCLKKSTAS